MAKKLALMTIVLAGGALAAPLPPAVEKSNKEGITVVDEVTIRGSLNEQVPEGTHLFKLLKGQVYSIDLVGAELKMKLRIEGPDGKLLSVDSSPKISFKPVLDGTYRFHVSAPLPRPTKYFLGLRPLALGPALPPGVRMVGPGGLNIDSALNANDPIDKVRKARCKTFEVQMSAGKSYTIDMISQQIDSYLRLEDAAGKQLAQDDDSGGNLNARIIFRPQQDGVYRVISTTFVHAVGNFTLKVKEQ
jgi:hypothetical protein